MPADLLRHYNDELAHVRQLGDDFARRYPKIARRLRLSTAGSSDPHVERLIEAFAFLTARVQKRIDDSFPEIASAIMEIVQPGATSPIPPMTILKFALTRADGGIAGGHSIPKGTAVLSEPVNGEPCQFTTCSELRLFPVEVRSAHLNRPPFRAPEISSSARARSILRLKLATFDNELPLSEVGVDSLKFHLSGPAQIVHSLYELLFNHACDVAVTVGNNMNRCRQLGPDSIRPVGFLDEENMLPGSPNVPDGVTLLKDYFAFPEKFLFVEFAGLDRALAESEETEFEIFVYLDRSFEELERHISQENLVLGCVPCVNLFEQTAEPIQLTREQIDYPLTPDGNREFAREIHSIKSVLLTDTDGEESDVPELYSLHHTTAFRDQSNTFWVSKRHASRSDENGSPEGTDMRMAVVELDMDPANVDTESVLSVETLCTNRGLVGKLPFGGGHPKFHLETGGPIDDIECVSQPTPVRRPELGYAESWRMVSQLSLNFLSIVGGEDGAETLRELLRTFDHRESFEESFPFDGVISINTRQVVRRLPPTATGDGHRVEARNVVFAQGLEIELTLDEDRFVGVGHFLFACVLERFFAHYCFANSFTTLTLKTKQRNAIKSWPPRSGTKQLI